VSSEGALEASEIREIQIVAAKASKRFSTKQETAKSKQILFGSISKELH